MKTFKQHLSEETTFDVYIDKAYFPKELWPKGLADTVFERWKIQANSRTDAAQKIWAQHGERLERKMNPHVSSLPRKVSLNVSSPKAPGNSGNAGRLSAIVVKS